MCTKLDSEQCFKSLIPLSQNCKAKLITKLKFSGTFKKEVELSFIKHHSNR